MKQKIAPIYLDDVVNYLNKIQKLNLNFKTKSIGKRVEIQLGSIDDS